MKQETGKTSKKWLWLAIALIALVAVVGAVLMFILTPGQGGEGTAGAYAQLYWNIDRQQYIEAETGMSTRTKAEDGMYHMLVAFEGQQVDLTVADKQLVNFIDSMDVVGLILSADGEIVDAVDPKTVATETAREFYVQNVNENVITLNSSQALNGLELEVVLTQNSGVYDVDPEADPVGKPGVCDVMDMVIVYSDMETGEATHVYITEHPPVAELYWRVEQKIKDGKTARVPDENGVYTITFAHDGEQVELKCRDEELVTEIDSSKTEQNAEFALQLDEEGYIVNSVDVALSLRGKRFCEFYHVTEINGSTVTVTDITGSEQGDVQTFTLNADCDIFMCCDGCCESHEGERITELQLNDQVDVYTDTEGNPLVIFVTRRLCDSPMYFNVERQYGGAKVGTKRELDKNGYYVFEMFCDGKLLTLRTRDKAIADQVDAVYDRCMGLRLNGDIIEKVFLARCVYGGITFGTERYITQINGVIFTTMNNLDFSLTGNQIMSADCKIYDMTTGYFGVEYGEETTLNQYDMATGYKNLQGETEVIYVIDRYIEGSKLCWNIERKYDAEKQVTTRQQDENGYYVFTVATDGKTANVKTKSKSLATYIDSQTSMSVALKLGSNGIIQGAYPAHAAVQYGSKGFSSHYVKRINSDGSFSTYYMENGVKKDSAVEKRVMADNCVVYNVSTGYITQRGEKTKLQKDDLIQAFVTNPDGEIAVIFVFGRKLDIPLYWPVSRQYNAETKETTRIPDKDGYYVIDLAVDGAVKQFKTKDKAIATYIDSKTTAFTMVVDGDVINRTMEFKDTQDVTKAACGGYDVMSMDGNQVVLTHNRPLASNYGDTLELTFAKDCKFYDVSSYAKEFGAESTLAVGDRATCYVNADGEVTYCYITYKCNREAGHISYCEHCDKEVWWEPYATFYETDAHYYLTKDTYTGMLVIGKNAPQLDIALDLNGFELSSPNRAFNTYCTLSIMDSAGGGSISTKNQQAYNGSGVMIMEAGTLNLYGGTITSQNVNPAAYGGIVYIAKSTGTFNMYGGTIEGGHTTTGGGNVCNVGGVFNMYGGTIRGGTTDGTGGNILSTSIYGTVNLMGGTVEGDAVINRGAVTVSGIPVISMGKQTGLKLGQDVKLELGELGKSAAIVIDAVDAFTKSNEKAADYVSCFTAAGEGDSVAEKDGVLYYVKAGTEIKEDELKLDANGYAECPVCKETVQWTAVSGSTNASRVGDYKSGHYYLSTDVNLPANVNNFATAAPNKSLCIHLNGKNLTYGSRIAIAYDNSIVNIMGSGNVTLVPYTGTLANNAAGLYVQKSGTLNLYGGTYTNTDSTRPMLLVDNASGMVNIGQGVEFTGGAKIAVGTLSLGGASDVDMISVAKDGKLIIKADWTGVARASFAAALEDGKVPEANGVCEGTYAGTLTAANGGAITGENGRLLVGEAPDSIYGSVLELDADGNAMCPVCNENVHWTAVADGGRVGTDASGHYYLSGDVTSTHTQFATVVTANNTLCLHLNGNTLTTAGRIALLGEKSAINIMGSGTLVGTGTYNSGTDHYTEATLVSRAAGSVNIYGSTVISSASGKPAVLSLHSRGTINIYDAVVYGGVKISGGWFVSGR